MVSVILDTCIYGKIIKDKNSGGILIENIIKDSNFNILNFKVIRDELRKAPIILPIYDRMVSKSTILVTK